MSDFVARQGGLFFENIQTPQEKKEAEYRRRLRVLEAKVADMQEQLQLLTDLIKEANNG